MGFDDVVSGELEDIANQFEVQRIVLDHKDSARRHEGPGPTLRSASSSWSRLTGLRRYTSAPRAMPCGLVVDDRGDDHGDLGGGGVRFELSQHVPAIKPWQLDVEHDGGGQHLADQLETLDAVPGPQCLYR